MTGNIVSFRYLKLFSIIVQVPYAEVAGKTLVFNVYDFDRFSKHDQIGQIQVPLGSVDLARVIEEWKDLNPPDDDEKVRACLCICICMFSRMCVCVCVCVYTKCVFVSSAFRPFLILVD